MTETEMILQRLDDIEDLLRNKVVLEPALNLEQISEKYNVPIDTLYRYIRSGKLKAFRMGKLHVNVSDIVAAQNKGLLVEPEYKTKKSK